MWVFFSSTMMLFTQFARISNFGLNFFNSLGENATFFLHSVKSSFSILVFLSLNNLTIPLFLSHFWVFKGNSYLWTIMGVFGISYFLRVFLTGLNPSMRRNRKKNNNKSPFVVLKKESLFNRWRCFTVQTSENRTPPGGNLK